MRVVCHMANEKVLVPVPRPAGADAANPGSSTVPLTIRDLIGMVQAKFRKSPAFRDEPNVVVAELRLNAVDGPYLDPDDALFDALGDGDVVFATRAAPELASFSAPTSAHAAPVMPTSAGAAAAPIAASKAATPAAPQSSQAVAASTSTISSAVTSATASGVQNARSAMIIGSGDHKIWYKTASSQDGKLVTVDLSKHDTRHLADCIAASEGTSSSLPRPRCIVLR